MADSMTELNNNRLAQLSKFAELLPGVFGQVRAMTGDIYQDGELSTKVKRLIGLSAAMSAGCQNCTLAQTMYALDCGATKEEILETISVVISLRGTTGMAESLKVIQFLDEQGKL